MQVNSAQDYLTRRKRQIVAATYHSIPPPQSRRHNSVFLTAMANGDDQRSRFVTPTASAWGSVPGGATYTSFCCLSNSLGAPGTFARVTDRGFAVFPTS